MHYYTFPGDTDLPSLPKTEWSSIVTNLVDVAAIFGMPVSAQTQERWLRGVTCARLLDNLVDESSDPEEAQRVFKRLIFDDPIDTTSFPKWVEPDLVVAMQLLNASLRGVSTRAESGQLGMELAAFAPKKAALTNAWAYARLVVEEDKVTTRLVMSCMSEEERQHPAYPIYRKWCEDLMIFLGLRDSIRDLANDYSKGQIGVKPTRTTWRIMMVRLAWESRVHLANPKPLKALLDSFYKRRQPAEPRTLSSR